MPKHNVLITGVTGFVGKSIVNCLSQDGKYALTGAVRSQMLPELSSKLSQVFFANLDAHTGWKAALKGIYVLIHTARGSI